MSRADDHEKSRALSDATVLLRTKQWIDNFFANLPYIRDGVGVNILHGCLEGEPSILVGAGPSLSKNIDQLPELRDRACIIACDAALDALLTAGVQPHFVLAADSKERVAKYLDLPHHDCSNITLVADVRIHPKTRECWDGPILWYQGPQVDSWSFSASQHRWTGQIGVLGSGGSVMTNIFGFSSGMLGNIPIIFVGADASFEKIGQTHAREVKNTESYEHFEPEQVENIYGEMVWSNAALQMYKRWFEDMFMTTPGVFVNCTEGGIMQRGCLIMDLAEATEIFMRHEAPIVDKINQGMIDGRKEMAEYRWKGLEHDRNAPYPVLKGMPYDIAMIPESERDTANPIEPPEEVVELAKHMNVVLHPNTAEEDTPVEVVRKDTGDAG